MGAATPRPVARTHYIPAAPVVRLLLEWEARNELERLKFERPTEHGSFVTWDNPPKARNILGERAGVSIRQMYQLMSGAQKRISFDLADKLLSLAGLSEMWYSDPELSQHYGPLPVFIGEEDRQDITDEERVELEKLARKNTADRWRRQNRGKVRIPERA